MGLDLPFTFDLSGVDVAEMIEEYIENDDRYRPFIISIDSDHAKYIEFGTNGSTSGTKRPRAKRGTKTVSNTEKAIRDWVKARKGTEDNALAHLIYRRVMENGIPPQPFIRPALHEMARRFDAGDIDPRKSTSSEIAEMYIAEMERNLRDNHTLYGEERILNSISYEIIEPGEYDMYVGSTENLGITDEIWDDDLMDLNGDPKRAKDRKDNIDKLRW